MAMGTVCIYWELCVCDVPEVSVRVLSCARR
jgi:hypothetical protein